MELPRIDFRYLKEAFKEPINFWGMAGFAVAAAYVQDVTNQLKQAEHAIQSSTDDRQKRIQQANAEILKRRVAAFQDLERSVRLVEGQLQSIENFFGLVNDQVVTLPTPERVSSINFEELSDSIAMTRQMLEETADTFGMLDNQNRELDLLLSSGK